MRVTSIRYVEHDTEGKPGSCFELEPECLSQEEFGELRDLLDRSGVLFYQAQRGEIPKTFELLIHTEALDGNRGMITCDVAFSAEHQELAEFVKKKGRKIRWGKEKKGTTAAKDMPARSGPATQSHGVGSSAK